MIVFRFMAYGVGAISTPLGGLVGGGICTGVVLGSTYLCAKKTRKWYDSGVQTCQKTDPKCR